MKSHSIVIIVLFVLWLRVVSYTQQISNEQNNNLLIDNSKTLDQKRIRYSSRGELIPGLHNTDQFLKYTYAQEGATSFIKASKLSHEELIINSAVSFGLLSKSEAERISFQLISAAFDGLTEQESRAQKMQIIEELLGKENIDLIDRQIELNLEALEIESLNRELQSDLFGFYQPIEVTKELDALFLGARVGGSSTEELHAQLNIWLDKQFLPTDVTLKLKNKIDHLVENDFGSKQEITITPLDPPKPEVDRLSQAMGLSSRQYVLYREILLVAQKDLKYEIEYLESIHKHDGAILRQAFRNARSKFEYKLKAIVTPEQYQRYELERDLSAFDRLNS
jgi:hypothetical protein